VVFGQAAAEGRLLGQIPTLVGKQAAHAIQTFIESTQKAGSGITIIGAVALLFGASRVFAQLENALNMIWDVERKVKQGVVGFIVDRVLAIVIVLGVALLLLLSLTVGTWFAAFGNVLANVLPGIAYVYALRIVNYVIIFFIFTLLFAIIYKTLPNVSITWDDVWVGAAATALLLTIGQALTSAQATRSLA